MRRAPPFAVRFVLLLVLVLVALLAAGALAGAMAGKAPLLHIERAELLLAEADAATPALIEVDSHVFPGNWRTVALPYAQASDLLRQAGSDPGAGGGVATLWYRLRVGAFTPPAVPLMLYAARAKAHGPIAVYIDGRLRAQYQIDGPSWYWEPLWLALDDGRRSAAPREILIRMQQPRQLRSALASVWLGPDVAIGWRYQGRQWLQLYLPLMSVGAFLGVGLFSFVIWRRGGNAGYGFFAILAVVQFIRSLSFFSTVRMSNDWFAWCMLNSLFWIILIVHRFQVYMHGRRQRLLSVGLATVAIGVGVFSLPPLASGGNTPLLTPLIYLFGMASSIAVTVAGARAGWRRDNAAVLLSVGVGLCTVYGIVDWLLQSNFLGPESWYLGPYISLQNFVLVCYLIYKHYTGAQVDVEHSNRLLAGRLAQRKRELAATYARLREVEHQQTLTTERQRLLQDMHDGLGSSLHTALRAIEDGRSNAPAVSDVLRFCIDDLHLTIDSLEPVESDLLLLLATLRYRLGERLRQAGAALRWNVVDLPPLDWVDPRAALHILRILQEALVNAAKHSRATNIALSTAVAKEGIEVAISDNGGGFDLALALARPGSSLLNQQRRAAAIGGAIDWTTGAGGTRVTLWLPLRMTASQPSSFI